MALPGERSQRPRFTARDTGTARGAAAGWAAGPALTSRPCLHPPPSRGGEGLPCNCLREGKRRI